MACYICIYFYLSLFSFATANFENFDAGVGFTEFGLVPFEFPPEFGLVAFGFTPEFGLVVLGFPPEFGLVPLGFPPEFGFPEFGLFPPR